MWMRILLFIEREREGGKDREGGDVRGQGINRLGGKYLFCGANTMTTVLDRVENLFESISVYFFTKHLQNAKLRVNNVRFLQLFAFGTCFPLHRKECVWINHPSRLTVRSPHGCRFITSELKPELGSNFKPVMPFSYSTIFLPIKLVTSIFKAPPTVDLLLKFSMKNRTNMFKERIKYRTT